jgi:hypothetical protein
MGGLMVRVMVGGGGLLGGGGVLGAGGCVRTFGGTVIRERGCQFWDGSVVFFFFPDGLVLEEEQGGELTWSWCVD